MSAEHGATKNNAETKLVTPSITVRSVTAGALQQKQTRFGIITKAVGGLTV